MEQLLEEFDPFTPKSRSVVTSFYPDAEGEFQTVHRSRITTTVPDPDDTATITVPKSMTLNDLERRNGRYIALFY